MGNGKFPPMPPGYGKSAAEKVSKVNNTAEKEVVINSAESLPPLVESPPVEISQEESKAPSKKAASFENMPSSYFDDGDTPQAPQQVTAAPESHDDVKTEENRDTQQHYQEAPVQQQPQQNSAQQHAHAPQQHHQGSPNVDPNMMHAGAVTGAAYAANPSPQYDPEEVLFSSHPAMFSNKPTVFIMYVLMLPILVGFAGFIFWRMQIKAARLQVKGRTIYYKEGIFAKQTAEINVENTRTIKVVQSFAQRIFSTGDVLIYTGGDEPEVIAKGYPNLQEFNAVIGKLKANTPPGMYPHRY